MEPKVYDKTRLVANILMIVLVVMNIFFSYNFIQGNVKQTEKENQKLEEETQKMEQRLKVARFMKLFVEGVLIKGGGESVSYQDRIDIEYGIKNLNDTELSEQWNALLASTDSTSAQKAALKLMSSLANKML